MKNFLETITPSLLVASIAFCGCSNAKPDTSEARTSGPPSAIQPVLVGPLAAPSAPVAHESMRFYGTDLGWSFEHDGAIFMLFGDTMSSADFYCQESIPVNDDTQARLPMSMNGGVPPIEFATRADAPTELSTIEVIRGTESLSMGLGQTPLTGFSDGTHAYGVFGREEYSRCNVAPDGTRTCGADGSFLCSETIGECTPETDMAVLPCELLTQQGCLLGQTCQPSTQGFCVDPTSSQNGDPLGQRFPVARNNEIGVQQGSGSTTYRSIVTFVTEKFHNVTAQTVAKFTGRTSGSDYSKGAGELLMWGRPAFVAEQGLQAQLYLMRVPLPLLDESGSNVRFEPTYFAGLDESGEPVWRPQQSDAAPLALDGQPGGSPHEPLPIVNQMAVAWLGDPIRQWVMLYGGDLPDVLLTDPLNSRLPDAPGAIRIRFAEHPWGPWTPQEPHLRAGDPTVASDPYGPGGFLYHPACVDAPNAPCADSDPYRPQNVVAPDTCVDSIVELDAGRLYAPNIIDDYIMPNGNDGLDVYWNVSTWNPYGVVLMKTTFRAKAVSRN